MPCKYKHLEFCDPDYDHILTGDLLHSKPKPQKTLH